jgi:hypothetical protein
LYVTPVAGQCCLTTPAFGSPGNYITFIKGGTGGTTVVTRYRNPYGTPCTETNGTTPCTTSNCYYGPLGFSAASMQSVPNATVAETLWTSGGGGLSSTYICQGQTGGTPAYPDTTGNQPRTLSCPSGDPGGAASVWLY